MSDDEHLRVWCRQCGEPVKYHLPDCPVLNEPFEPETEPSEKP